MEPRAPARGPETPALEHVLATGQFVSRCARVPDWQGEVHALRRIGEHLSGSLREALAHVLEVAQTLCRAGSAGVSVLETGRAGGREHEWSLHRVAGVGPLSSCVGERVAWQFSPCWTSLVFGEPQLF